jgi:hypothetical protein
VYFALLAFGAIQSELRIRRTAGFTGVAIQSTLLVHMLLVGVSVTINPQHPNHASRSQDATEKSLRSRDVDGSTK